MDDPNRRRFLRAATVSTAALVGGCVAPVADDATHPLSEPVTAWPSFRGDRYNTGYARGVPSTGDDPAVSWRFEARGSFWGSPVVENRSVYIGSADASLYALDAETGAQRWAFPTDHRIEGTPAVADGTVFVGSYDQHLYAVDAETGAQRWKRPMGGLVRASPTVVDGVVYVGAGCHRLACSWYAEEAAVSEDGAIYALDAETGETIWRHDVDDEVVSTPAVTDDTVYVGSSNGTLYALAVDDGDVRWTYAVDDYIWSSPAVAFGTVFFGDWDGLVHAVDAGSGDPLWSTDTGGLYISSSVAVDREAVYVGMTPMNFPEPGTNYGELIALDRHDGTERWRFETDATEIGSSVAVTDDRLYFGTHQPTETDGNGVHALTTDGEPVWYMAVDARGVGSSPALVDGVLYVGGTDGVVYAVE